MECRSIIHWLCQRMKCEKDKRPRSTEHGKVFLQQDPKPLNVGNEVKSNLCTKTTFGFLVHLMTLSRHDEIDMICVIEQ